MPMIEISEFHAGLLLEARNRWRRNGKADDGTPLHPEARDISVEGVLDWLLTDALQRPEFDQDWGAIPRPVVPDGPDTPF